MLFDIRYSARKFGRTPGLSFALLLTIALGVGSNVAVQGFVRGLTKPDATPASIDGVVSIFGRDAHGEAAPLSYQRFLSLRTEVDGIEHGAFLRTS